MAVLREPEPKRMGMTWLRAAAFACLVVCTCWMGSILIGSGVDEAFTWSIFMPPLVVATLVPVAPLVLSALLRAWTSLVPQKRGIWHAAPLASVLRQVLRLKHPLWWGSGWCRAFSPSLRAGSLF